MILHTLLHQTTTAIYQWAGVDFPNLIHIDRTTTFTSFAYLFISSLFKCFAHTFECQRLMRINT